MKTKLIAGFLLAGSCLFAAPRIAIGVGVGVPVAPVMDMSLLRRFTWLCAPAYVPPMPAPGYTWVAGFWGPGHVWRRGYWAAPRGSLRFSRPFRR